METFLVDGDRQYDYNDLICSVNNNNFYYPLYKSNDLFSYFVNLIKALVHNKSLILLDADLNFSELDGVDKEKINLREELFVEQFISIEEIIKRLKSSTSEITIFTSGTTGQPKKVIHTVSSLTRAVRLGNKYASQIWAYAYNPTHMAGLQVFFQAFENTSMLVNMFSMQRQKVYSLINQYHITHISATPTFYRLLLPFEKEYSSVERVTFGGEKSEYNLYESIKLIFPNAQINNVYASTEAGSLFASRGDCFQIPESIRDKFKVEEDELLIHKSLLGRSESFSYSGDYFRSGDLIEWVDKANFLFKFKSRKNELINVGGYKVNPGEVESVILKQEGVKQALVYGRANSVLGNILCADVILYPGSVLTDLDIRKALRSELQDFKIPRRIKFVENMLLTRTGKLKRT